MTAKIQAQGLSIAYRSGRGDVMALDGADLTVPADITVGLVGESGSGKTTLGMAIGRLLPGNARRTNGDLAVDARSVFDLDDLAITELRRTQLGFIFQSPMAALNPTATIGRQLNWALAGRREPGAHDLLRQVGLADSDRIMRAYPNELSGGMAQRVVIAMAIARRPSLLIADEPTASLDASIRAQILELIVSLRRQLRATLVVMSHELALVARYCDHIAVMYGGRVVETGPARDVLSRPFHPYTRALLHAAPGAELFGERLTSIPGMPPVLNAPSSGCAFVLRCQFALDRCRDHRPQAYSIDDRQLLCHVEAGALTGGAKATGRPT